MPTPERLAEALTSYVVLLFSLSFHEAAHAWTASRMGDQTAREAGRVSLNPLVHIDPIGTVLMPLLQIFAQGIPLLAWAKPTPVVARNFRPGEYRRGQVLVAGAGPLSNLLLASVFASLLFVAVRLLGVHSERPLLDLIVTGVLINVMLAIFNLLPVPPLDGSWVASYGLPPRLGEAYDRLVRPYGMWILLILVVTGAISVVTRPLIRLVSGILFSLALSQ
jgi:Zn-dependent protease